MRIAFSTSSFVGNIANGLSVYMEELLINIFHIDRNNEYHIFIPKNHIELFNSVCSTTNKNVHFHIIYAVFNRPVLNIFWHFFIYPFHLRKNKIELLHLPEYRRLLIYSGCKTVMTVHDLIGIITNRFDASRYIYNKFIVFPLLKKIDYFIAVSDNTRQDLIKYVKIPEVKVTVVYEGVRPQFKKRGCNKISKFNNDVKNTQYILYVARIEHPNKNHYNLLKAFKLLKDHKKMDEIKLVFVGDRYKNNEVIFNLIKILGLEKDVIITGHVNDSDLPFYYNCAKLLVFPSLYEGFGIPIIEAYASQLPAICSNSSSLKELACNEKMLFDPLNPISIKDKIYEFVTNDKLIEDQIASQNLHLRNFQWNNAANQTIKIYNNV